VKNDQNKPELGEDDEKSGIKVLDDAIAFIDTIPDLLGKGAFKETPAGVKSEKNGDRSAVVKSMIISLKLARRLAEVQDKPGYYGVVFCLLSQITDPNTVDYSQLAASSRVKILASEEYPDLVGKVGYTANEPTEMGTVLVLFEDGRFGNFIAAPPDERFKRAIEYLPSDKKVVVIFEGRFVELNYPEHVTLETGTTVKLDLTTNQIISVVDIPNLPGDIATVKRVMGKQAEIDLNGSSKIVILGDHASTIEEGNRVVLDTTNRIIIHNLGDQDVDYRFREKPDVTWDDIGGQDDAKEVLKEMIDDRFDHPEIFERFHKKPPKGALLLGPTGCGKSMLAKAAGYSLYKRFGEPALTSGFFYIRGPEIFRSLVGEGEAILRHIFILEKKHLKKYGFPAIIFIDECEGVGKKRGTGTSGDYFETMVQTLLNEMNDTTAILILATNRADMLDPALSRHERIDRKIYVKRPDRLVSEQIFNLYLKNQPLVKDLTYQMMAKRVSDKLFSDSFGMLKLTVQLEKSTTEKIFGFQHIINGAMINGIVGEAISAAGKRQKKDGQPAFLTADDLDIALTRVFQGELLVDHSEDMKEYVENMTEKVISVQKLYQGRK
jgi:proteasome-associated ATPase